MKKTLRKITLSCDLAMVACGRKYLQGVLEEILTSIGVVVQVYRVYAFNILVNIWKSADPSYQDEAENYKSDVRSVLLYASETWRPNKNIENRQVLNEGAQGTLEQRVTNGEIAKRTNINKIIMCGEKKKVHRWLGHILHVSRRILPQVAHVDRDRKRGRLPVLGGLWKRREIRPGMSSDGLAKTVPAGYASLMHHAPAGAKRIK